MTTAFGLTGGGSLGAVQVGMLTALHECRIEPDLLLGTSVGAVNAAHLAGPGSTDTRLESLVRLWHGMRRAPAQPFPASFHPSCVMGGRWWTAR